MAIRGAATRNAVAVVTHTHTAVHETVATHSTVNATVMPFDSVLALICNSVLVQNDFSCSIHLVLSGAAVAGAAIDALLLQLPVHVTSCLQQSSFAL
jgi:hypothetical protein